MGISFPAQGNEKPWKIMDGIFANADDRPTATELATLRTEAILTDQQEEYLSDSETKVYAYIILSTALKYLQGQSREQCLDYKNSFRTAEAAKRAEQSRGVGIDEIVIRVRDARTSTTTTTTKKNKGRAQGDASVTRTMTLKPQIELRINPGTPTVTFSVPTLVEIWMEEM